MVLRELVKCFQRAANKARETEAGTWLAVDGEWGPKTAAAADQFEIEIVLKPIAQPIKPLPVEKPVDKAPWLTEAKKYQGKAETDSTFNRYLSGFWKIVGLSGYKTIIGSAFAWCGLFVAMSLYNVGIPWQKDGAGARNWAKYGVAIDWKADGVPRGAIVHINHNGLCSSGSSNHVAISDGDCTPQDLRSGAINLYGGNQGNMAKVSAFPVSDICAVRWPAESEKPGPVKVSKGCKGKPGGESTR